MVPVSNAALAVLGYRVDWFIHGLVGPPYRAEKRWHIAPADRPRRDGSGTPYRPAGYGYSTRSAAIEALFASETVEAMLYDLAGDLRISVPELIEHLNRVTHRPPLKVVS